MIDSLPCLTVFITAGNYRERVANALASVLTQKEIGKLEIIILECGDPENPPVVGSDHPNVRIVHFPMGVSAGHVRAEAVRMAKTPFIVFLEEHAAVCTGWADAILNAFEEGDWACVGPCIINGNPQWGISDSLSLCYYPFYEAAPVRKQEVWTPFHNSAYRRDIVLKYNDNLPRLFALEILLQWQLGRDGYRILLEPAARIMHYYETDIYAMWKADHNAARVFIVSWSALFGWPVWKKVFRLLSVPIMPFVRAIKLFRVIAKNRPDQLRRYFEGLPVILFSFLADTTGEFMGLLFGAGDADVRYLDHSVNAPRELPPDFPHFSL